jgi:high-affinity iron transporter
MPYKNFFLFIILLSLFGIAHARTIEPITVNAIMTATDIQFSPDIIPENTPFIIHVINKAGVPVELENSDTSVEVYADMDKTFKVGLTAGKYIFFNDFNPHTKTAILFVKIAAELNSARSQAADLRDVATRTPGSVEYKDVRSRKTQPVIAGSSATAQASKLEDSEILFIVWRESVEALLVVGIVYSWLKQTKTERKSGMFYLWIGVGIGLLCAILLSFLLVTIKNILPLNTTNYFQATMSIVAAGMIVYMVKWMREKGRTLKAGMHNALAKNATNKWRNISIVTVVAVALAREASEATIFIYALGFGAQGESSIKMFSILALGVALAILTIYLLQLGNKIFSWRFFFKVTEILLLLLGGGLLLNCVDLLVSSGLLPALYTRVWDTSFLLGAGGFLTPLISSFTGYRATPSLMDIIFYGAYWIFIYMLFKTKRSPGVTK